MYAWTSEPEQGQPYALEAVELARRLGDDGLIVHSIIRYSLIWSLAADEARPLYTEALARSERSGDSMSKLEAHGHAAVDELDRGNILGARVHAEEAVLLMRQIREDAAVMNLLGLVLRAERDPAARPTFEAALQLARRHGDYNAIAMSFLGLACVAADLGDWQRAAEMHGVAQAARDRTSSPWGLLGAPRREDSVAVTRSAVGDEQFERAHARGLALGIGEAFELALRP
jgi:tetratricopeptide (TPR) repeat protein